MKTLSEIVAHFGDLLDRKPRVTEVSVPREWLAVLVGHERLPAKLQDVAPETEAESEPDATNDPPTDKPTKRRRKTIKPEPATESQSDGNV